MDAVLRVPPDTVAAERTVRRLREAIAAQLPGTAIVGGMSAGLADLSDRLAARTPLVVIVAVVLDALLLMAAFRSLVIPLKATGTTLLSVCAALGFLRVVYQDINGSPLAYFLPLFLFAVAFGLSTDYEVFLLSRIREAYGAGSGSERSIEEGLVQSSRAITLAGLILITVFLGFVTASMLPFRQVGVGLAVVIFIDITIVRGLLVPALVALLGKWNWWFPGRRQTVTT